jgi:hypothetical protein
VNAEGGNLSAKGQYTRLALVKVGASEWVLSGDRIA